jgi:hypothetical protein
MCTQNSCAHKLGTSRRWCPSQRTTRSHPKSRLLQLPHFGQLDGASSTDSATKRFWWTRAKGHHWKAALASSMAIPPPLAGDVVTMGSAVVEDEKGP